MPSGTSSKRASPPPSTQAVSTRSGTRSRTSPPEQQPEAEPSLKKARVNKGKGKQNAPRSIGLGAEPIVLTVVPEFAGLSDEEDEEEPPITSQAEPFADKTNTPIASSSSSSSKSRASTSTLPSSTSPDIPTSSSHADSDSIQPPVDPVDRVAYKAAKALRKQDRAEARARRANAAEVGEAAERETLRLAAEEQAKTREATLAQAQRPVPVVAPKAVRASRLASSPIDKLIKQAGKQTAYMKACWLTGQQHRVIFHGECGPGAEDDWIVDGPLSEKHDTLKWTLEIKTYVSRLLRTVPSEYSPDDIQKLFVLGMTMARAEMRTRIDQAVPKLFGLIPPDQLEDRNSQAVRDLQGKSGMDFAYLQPYARTASERAFLSPVCLIKMGSALVWGLESITADSPMERRLGKPSTTKAIQWDLKETTPSFVALCVLCIRWKLSGVANFQAESQSLKFAQLYRQIRIQLTVDDDTPDAMRSRVNKLLRLWTTSLFEPTESDEESDGEYQRPDVDFAADFSREFCTDSEEEEEEQGDGQDHASQDGMDV